MTRKYATFYVKRKMSEDFRDTPLVRTPVSRNAIGVLHYIFASWKNIVASVNGGHAGSDTEIQSQAVQKDAKQSAFQKRKPDPMDFAMSQGWDNDSSHRLYGGNYKSRRITDMF